MEVGLIIVMFISNALGLDCLYNRRYKLTGSLFIINLCLTVALAYQFQQMEKIVNLLLIVAGIVLLLFAIRFYIKKKKSQKIQSQNENVDMIEEKE